LVGLLSPPIYFAAYDWVGLLGTKLEIFERSKDPAEIGAAYCWLIGVK